MFTQFSLYAIDKIGIFVYYMPVIIWIMNAIAQDWQLSFDFNAILIKNKNISERTNFTFYQRDSIILKDSFSIKIKYCGRSYILKWRYRIETIKAFSDSWDRLKSIWYVDLDKVLAYSWFMYSVAFISKTEKLKLTKLVEKLLSNYNINENLADY